MTTDQSREQSKLTPADVPRQTEVQRHKGSAQTPNRTSRSEVFAKTQDTNQAKQAQGHDQRIKDGSHNNDGTARSTWAARFVKAWGPGTRSELLVKAQSGDSTTQ